MLAAFVSGAAGLLYEIVWIRSLGLIVGGEAAATHSVLAAYFVGSAAGAYFLGRRFERAESPLAVYALLETAVMGTGLLSLGVLQALDHTVPLISSGSSGPGLGAIGFGAALLVCFPATFCMGATLPILVGASVRGVLDTQRAVSRLYCFNTLGAVGGSLAAVLVLLVAAGSRATIGAAAALNLLAALVALGARKQHLASSQQAISIVEHTESGQPARCPHGDSTGITGTRLLAALGLAGFAGLAFQIAAVRVLALTIESTVYSFCVTLSAYLLGIVVASGLCARTRIVEVASKHVPVVLGLAALALAASGHLLRAAHPLHTYLQSVSGETFYGQLLAQALTAMIVVLPAALPTTLVFCTLTPSLALANGRPISAVGSAVMATTLGSGLAPLVVGFVAFALDGARGGVWTSVIALTLATLIVMPWKQRAGASIAQATILVTPTGIAVALCLMLPTPLFTWPTLDGRQLLYSIEGAGAAVAVEESGGHRLLRTGSKYFEGGSAGVFVERRQGHLPMLLHPRPMSALVLGLGTGTTLGAVAAHPGVRTDGVELLAEVLGTMQYFTASNGSVFDSPAVRLVHADARSFVRASAARGRKYDVVIADQYHPQQAGVGNLYTLEHFRATRQLLAPSGHFMQWLSLYELPPSALAVLVRTFLDVFPHVSGWYAYFNGNTGTLGLLGSNTPPALDWDRVTERSASPSITAILGGTLYQRPIELFGSFVIDRKGLERLAGQGPLNTDDRPIIEHMVPRGYRHDVELRMQSLNLVRRHRSLPDSDTIVFARDSERAAQQRAQLGGWQQAVDALLRGQQAAARRDEKSAAQAFVEGISAAPELRLNYLLLRALIVEWAQLGRVAEARDLIGQVVGIDPSNSDARMMLERFAQPTREASAASGAHAPFAL